MSVKTNLAIPSVGNLGSGFFENLAPPVPVTNGFTQQIVFTYRASQVGLNLITASVNLQAGDATTQVNRFRIIVSRENSGISLQDFISTATILPQYDAGNSVITSTFFRISVPFQYENDSSDEAQVTIFCDYQDNTAPLLIGGSFQSTKLI